MFVTKGNIHHYWGTKGECQKRLLARQLGFLLRIPFEFVCGQLIGGDYNG